MGVDEMEDDRNAGIEVEGILFVKKLDGRQMLKFTRVGISTCVAMAMLVLMRCDFWRLFLVGDEGAELRNGFFGWLKLSYSSWLGVL